METKTLRISLQRSVFALLLVLASRFSYSQSVLNRYIQEGLASNVVLQQKDISLQQAQQSLQIARSNFLPSVNLLGDYISGEGGRSISIPVGDLLNPVYASLNQLMQTDAFPQIKNVDQNFFPKNFYDARVRTSVPLINSDLHINRSIQGQQVMMKTYELEAYKHQLVREIKLAYFSVLSAASAEKIYESALKLVNKNAEINQSLLNNGKSLPANYLRSKSEVERVKADLTSAQNNTLNAKKYFNFLLNKDLNTEVDLAYPVASESLADTVSGSVSNRKELQMLQTGREINELSLQMSRLSRLPKMSAFLDLGSQAYNWKFNDHSRYYLVGVQFSMPLFQGFRNTMTARQNSLEIRKTELGLVRLQQQLQLSADVAKRDLSTKTQNYLAAREQLKSAQSYFNLIEKGYQEGVNSLIEYLDARNQLTSSQLQQNVRLFDALMATATLEYETASYEFKN